MARRSATNPAMVAGASNSCAILFVISEVATVDPQQFCVLIDVPQGLTEVATTLRPPPPARGMSEGTASSLLLSLTMRPCSVMLALADKPDARAVVMD